MTWLIINPIDLNQLFGASTSTESSGLGLFTGTLQSISSVSSRTSGVDSGFLQLALGFLPPEVQSAIGWYLIDTIILIAIPIIGIIIGIISYRIIQNSSPTVRHGRKLLAMRILGVAGLIPPIGLFFVLHTLIIAFFSGTLSRGESAFSVTLNNMGAGFWITLLGFLLMILAGPLAAPRQTK